MPTRILALDTATEACSVAVLDGDRVYASFELCARDHTRRILPLVQQLLAGAGLTLHQMDALAFGCGPGSFTGVRIGVGIAQGLALGADLPVIGISTLQTMAQSAWRLQQSEQVLAAIDARMGEVYWAVYRRDEQGGWQSTGSEAVLKPEAAMAHMATLSGSWTPVGTGWQAWPQLAKTSTLQLKEQRVTLPCAEDMLPLAAAELARGAAVTADRAQPVYLRNEVTWKKLPGRE